MKKNLIAVLFYQFIKALDFRMQQFGVSLPKGSSNMLLLVEFHM